MGNEATPKIKLVENEDEVLFAAGDYPPLLNCSEVDALCRSVKKETYFFKNQRRQSLVFQFEVYEPSKYQGIKLSYYAPIRKWKRSKFPPASSKLGKIAAVVTGRKRNRQVTRAMFEGKLFRCKVRPTKDDVPYTVVDSVTEVLVG